MGFTRTGRFVSNALVLTALSSLPLQPANAFCVRNDTGAPIRVEADGETAVFSAEIANNKEGLLQSQGGGLRYRESRCPSLNRRHRSRCKLLGVRQSEG